MRRYVKPAEPHPYNFRSDEDKIVEAMQYHLGMMKFLAERGYVNLAFSHYLYAQDADMNTVREMNERK